MTNKMHLLSGNRLMNSPTY